MKKIYLRATFASTLACSLALGAVATAEPTQPGAGPVGSDVVTLDLYNLTDIHGHIEQVSKKGVVKEAGIAAVGCYLDKVRAEGADASLTLLGDNIGATPWTSGALYDDPTIQVLNELKPEASTIGNHELDLGVDVFKARIDGGPMVINGKQITDGGKPINFTKVGFPYLGANVDGMGRYLGDKVIWTSKSGVKVAFIGAIAEDVPYKLSPGATKGLVFNDPISKINMMAEQLKTSGEANVVIAMLDDDVKNNYPKMGKYVDGIMGGDTHVPYDFTMVDGAEGNKLSGIASGSYTDNLANLRITFDKKTNKVVESKAILVKAEEVAKCGQKKEIADIVEAAKTKAKIKGNEVVAEGITATFKRGVYDDGKAVTPGSNRGIESSLGDLVADSMLQTVKTEEGKPVDIGMINAGGLREDLTPSADGKITYAQTFAVQPFSNDLGYVTITGAKVKEALEQQWKKDLTTQNSRPMLKLGVSSNVKYTYDPSLPFGKRITSVTVNGEPLDPNRMYTIGSVTFLLYGGDSFEALKSGGAPKIIQGYDRDRFNEYLKANPGVGPRMHKSSIGLTLPKDPVADGTELTIALRGLSFSEGPAITKDVTVTVGSVSAKADVDNSLKEMSNKPESAVITTDGAGQAVVKIKADGMCAAHTGNVDLPVTVSTQFGEVVPASQGLKVTVSCPEAAVPTAAPVPQEPKNPQADAPVKRIKAKKHNLANTGADVVPAALGGLALLAVGGGLVIARRRRG